MSHELHVFKRFSFIVISDSARRVLETRLVKLDPYHFRTGSKQNYTYAYFSLPWLYVCIRGQKEMLTNLHFNQQNHSGFNVLFCGGVMNTACIFSRVSRVKRMFTTHLSCASRLVQISERFGNAWAPCEEHMWRVKKAAFGFSPANSGLRLWRRRCRRFQIVAWLEAFYDSFHTYFIYRKQAIKEFGFHHDLL